MNSSTDAVVWGASSIEITTSVRPVSGRSEFTSTVPRIVQSHVVADADGGVDAGGAAGPREGTGCAAPGGATPTFEAGGGVAGDTPDTGASRWSTGLSDGSDACGAGCALGALAGVAGDAPCGVTAYACGAGVMGTCGASPGW